MNSSSPDEIEAYRDRTWRRLPELRIEDAAHAEQMVEDLGFCASLTDARRPGPSLYIAVCGRRDAFMPRNVQKDPEASLAWVVKDDVMRRGHVYYAKLVKGKSTFISRRLIPHFNARKPQKSNTNGKGNCLCQPPTIGSRPGRFSIPSCAA
jgi:hypothetical protein